MRQDEYQMMFEVEDAHWWYRGLRANLDLFWRRNVPREADLARTTRVLDAGCGTGAMMERIARRAHPFGIDFSIDAIRFCRRRGRENCAVASALALPCAPESFDAVISFDVLCHESIRDKLAPLREMHAALRPGGLLFLNLPAYQWLLSSHDAAVCQDRRFSRSQVEDMLRASGFQTVSITHWNALLLPVILPVRLWRKLFRPPKSDLAVKTSPFLNAAFGEVLKFERAAMRAIPLPFGLSIFAVARKT